MRQPAVRGVGTRACHRHALGGARGGQALRRGALLVLIGAAGAAADPAQDTDEGIRSACHGWVATGAADTLARGLERERSPRCDPEASPPAPAPAEEPPAPRPAAGGRPWTLSAPVDPDLQIDLDCEMDTRCREVRIAARDRGHPIPIELYTQVAADCGQVYACIGERFDDWPRSSPLRRKPESPARPAKAAAGPVSKPRDEPPPAVPLRKSGAPRERTPAPPRRPPGSSSPLGPGTRIEDNPVYAVDYTQSGSRAEQLAVRYRYTNRSRVKLRIGPVSVRIVCSDGASQLQALGPWLDVPPGATRGGSWSPDDEAAGRICPTREIAEYRAEPLPSVSQHGIGGPLEQRLVCPDGRLVAPVVRMAPDGRHFHFTSNLGGSLELTAADYDARHIAAAWCGGSPASYGSERSYVAQGKAFFSRDFHRYVTYWSDACSRDLASCLARYRKDYGD